MYQYMVKVFSEEHMLYPKEIAQLYGILTPRGDRNTRVVNLILKEYEILQGTVFPEIFYEYQGRPIRVWPFEIYDPAMRWFIERVQLTRAQSYIFSDGKTHQFILGEVSQNA